MECKGTVTEKEDNFCYTVIDHVRKVHWSILLAHNPLIKLPGVGSKVKFKNVHKHGQTFVVCLTSVLEGEFNIIIEQNEFVSLIRNNKLGAADLIQCDEILKLFENNFKDIDCTLKDKILLEILKFLLLFTDVREIDEHQCLNKQISHFNIISVSSSRFVEITSDKYSRFPEWSFGIHSHRSKNSMLFGYLKIHRTYGFLVLSDSHYQLPCVICKNSNCEKLLSLVNSYVLIKKYKVITEIFRENVPNLEYLLIEVEDISVIYTVICDNILGPSTNTSSENISFVLLKKSMTCINNENRCICFLQISIFNKNGVEFVEPETIFLIVPTKYIETMTALTEMQRYKLSFNSPLKVSNNVELSRLGPYKIFGLIDMTSHFQKLDDSENCDTLLTIEECKKYVLENKTGMISFQGILKSKKITTTSLLSRTKKTSTIYGFGTPGSRVHQLIFSYKENDKEIYLDCYLNNWENILMPLGLIPQMRIAVKNVVPQSKKYLKSTIFTSFDILSYEPPIAFQTVNLYENDDIDWGPRFFLGLGEKIPYGVLVWGRVYEIEILSVNISHSCKNCKTKSDISIPCHKCNETEKDIDFLLKMNVSDEYAQSKVLVKTPEFLKYILNLQDKQFEIWRQAFQQIGDYNFSVFEESQERLDIIHETQLFKDVLTKYFKVFNTAAIVSLDLKCRKLDSSPKKNGGRTLWWYIDARKN